MRDNDVTLLILVNGSYLAEAQMTTETRATVVTDGASVLRVRIRRSRPPLAVAPSGVTAARMESLWPIASAVVEQRALARQPGDVKVAVDLTK
jgi:hypothetical protein